MKPSKKNVANQNQPRDMLAGDGVSGGCVGGECVDGEGVAIRGGGGDESSGTIGFAIG